MTRIGIFGGTFDPPHKGHIAIAKQAMKQFSLKRVYLVPAYIPPHKDLRSSTTANQRLTMVKLAIGEEKGLNVSTVELRRRGISYTIDTLLYFKKQFPATELVLIIGADNLAQFHQWKFPKKILQLASLAVYKRQGFDQSLKNRNIVFQRIHGNLLRVSSTEIRHRLEHGLNISTLLSKPVEVYIKKHLLYTHIPLQKRTEHEINRAHR